LRRAFCFGAPIQHCAMSCPFPPRRSWVLLAIGVLSLVACPPVVPAVPAPQSQSAEPLPDAPPEPIAVVRQDTNGNGVPDRVGDTVAVAGRVTAAPGALPLPAQGVGAIEGPTGSIHVRLPGAEGLSRGDSVRVWGALRHEAGLAQIEGLGHERIETSRRVPSPMPLSVPSADGERYEGHLARVEGTITTRSGNRGGEYFVLREGPGSDAQLTVFVSTRHVERIRPGRVEEGDRVAVTGIIGQYDLSYQILPREAGDVAPVGQPATYLWWALGGIGGLGVVAVVVIIGLRAAVRRRTRALKQSQEELREKESRLRSITENISDGIYRSTDDGLVYANQAFLDLFGYSSLEEIQQTDTADLYADPDVREELTAREARQGALNGVEVEYRRKDGSTFVGLLSTRRVEGHNGTKTYYDGAITDITDQKRQQQELRETKSRYQTLLENFPEGAVFLFDQELTYQLAGGEGLAHVGLTPDDVVGRTIHDIFPADIAERQAEYYRRALKGQKHRFEAKYQGRHYRIQVLPVRGDDGQIVSGMAVSYDVSDRKRRQMALRDRQEKIEALYSAADHLLRASTPSEVGEALIRLVREALGYPGVSIRFVREGRLEVEHVAEDTFEFMPDRPDFPVNGDSAVAEVYRSGETLVVDDVEAATVQDPHDYGDLRATAVVPLGEHGTLAVASPEPGAIGDFDSHLIDVLGSYATAVLDRLDRAARLQSERDLLDRLLATSPAAIVLLSKDGAFVRVNDRAKEVLGIEKDQITSRTFSDTEWGVTAVDGSPIPPEELPFAKVIRTGEPLYGYEHAIEWPDGARRILSVSGAPLEGTDGELQGALFHLNDVTERKERKQVLRGRKEKIEALYETTRHLLQAESREEVSSRVHEVVQDVFAYPFGHTTFLDGDTFVPERTLAPDRLRVPDPEPRPAGGDTIIDRTLRAGEATVVASTEALDNDLYYGDLGSAAGVPIGEHGVIVVGRPEEGTFDQLDLHLLEVLGGYAALVLDRLQREEALRVAKEEAEAARVDAEEARDEARKASQVKSAFLANMSHEIRTPLTSIIGFAEALGEEFDGQPSEASPNGAAGRFASLIEQGGRRLLQTLNGVLNLSKLEAGQMDLSATAVDLTTKARQAAEELRPKADEKGLRLDTSGCEPDVTARADDGAVQIILQNLLSNAIKYTEEGRVDLRAYLEEGRAVVEVEDTGIGMDPEVAQDLFEPFRQASEGIGREYEGSGVGLAVTQKAVEKMDGRIEVETEKGVGSRFTVDLPAFNGE